MRFISTFFRIVGHAMVVLSVFYHEELYRPLNILVVNLTVAQFFMLFITVFGDIVVMLAYPNHQFIIEHRDLLGFCTYVFSVATSVFYGFIAANRLFAVNLETIYARTDAWKMVWTLSILGWILSLLAALFPWMAPSLLNFTWDAYFILGFPWFGTYSNNTGLYWTLMALYFFLPGICVVCCYTAVTASWSPSQQLAGVPVNSQKAINVRDRASVLQMLCTCSTLYLICFFTTFIYWTAGSRSRSGDFFFLWLVYVSNSINPIIYGIIYPKFREAYYRIAMWTIRRWRKPYGDSRKVFPSVLGGIDVATPPSIAFHSARNSIIFHNGGTFSNNTPPLQENQFITLKHPATNTTQNKDFKVAEVSNGSTNK